jgi:hypothetical protein
MKLVGILGFLLMSILLQNCDNNITIATTPSRYVANQYVEKIDGKEELTTGIKEFLSAEQNLHNKDLWGKNAFNSKINPKYAPETNPKFPLPYYLIPESGAKFIYSENFNLKIKEQLYLLVSGVKYLKLFVHPESENHYSFLKNAYRFIGPTETEFMASPTSSYRSLVVWNPSKKRYKPFIVKVSLSINDTDHLISKNEIEKSISNQRAYDLIGEENLDKMNVKIFPESAGLLFEHKVNGAPKKVGGQLIGEIPKEISNNSKKWLSFSSLMSPNHTPHPLILNVIKKSGLSSYDFFETYMINSYLAMFENISLKHGINFEPHSQNLILETSSDFKPTGKWVIRDFGGFSSEIATKVVTTSPLDIKNNKPLPAPFRTIKSNFISSYILFYKKKVFDVLLDQVAKYDSTLTQVKIDDLKSKIDKMYLKQINAFFKINLNFVPDMMLYYKIEGMVLEQSTMINRVDKKILKESSELRAFFERKKANQEWIELSKKSRGKSSYFLTDHAIYEVTDNKIIGLALFNQRELSKHQTNTGISEAFLKDFQYTPGTGCFGMTRNFFW